MSGISNSSKFAASTVIRLALGSNNVKGYTAMLRNFGRVFFHSVLRSSPVCFWYETGKLKQLFEVM